jgi:hypothetical protein
MTEKTTVTLYHPTADLAREVPKADVEKWTRAGWLKSKPKAGE